MVADILWKATHSAVGWGGYQDGFGITTNLPPNEVKLRNRKPVAIKPKEKLDT